MSTSEKKGRAWVPATVTTLLVVVLLFGCGLVREFLEDRDVAALRDPDSVLGVFVYSRMAPTGNPGIIGDFPFDDSIARLGGGLVPVVVVVFLFTWISARAARAGSALTVLLGAWLGTVLGVGLGALASVQVFVWQNDYTSETFPGLKQFRAGRLGDGLYWGAVAGLFVGLVALLVWLMVRPRSVPDEPGPPRHIGPPSPDPDPGSEPSPADVASYPPPGQHARPAGTPPEETVRAPEPPPDAR